MNYLGLDLAGANTRPTGVCMINQKLRVTCSVVHSDSEILSIIRRSGSRVVAIDAPLALPLGRHCLGEHCRGRSHFRACDLVLRKMGIRFFPITLGPMRTLTSRGMRLVKLIRQLHVDVIETYPGAAQDLLGIPRKQYGLEAPRLIEKDGL